MFVVRVICLVYFLRLRCLDLGILPLRRRRAPYAILLRLLFWGTLTFVGGSRATSSICIKVKLIFICGEGSRSGRDPP